MTTHFAKLLERATGPDGTLDLARLETLVNRVFRRMRHGIAMGQLRMNAAIDSTGHAISIYDRHHKLVHCNAEFLRLYRLPKRLGRTGTTFEDVLRGRVKGGSHVGEDGDAYVADRLAAVERRLTETKMLKLNSGTLISLTHVPLADGGWMSMHKDITEFTRMQEELAHRAYTDALTGLPNRHMLQTRLDECFNGGGPIGPFALLIIDLDDFKMINDTLGHAAGDTVLTEIAQRLTTATGGKGMVARMGGDEFAIVMADGASARDAHMLAIALTDAGRRPVMVDGQSMKSGLSVGIALAPSDGQSADELLKNADLALYAAKKERRGGYRFFEPQMDMALRDRRKMEVALTRALEHGEMELVYQPILNLKTQSLSGFEALIRWNHPDEGRISPARFIPVAEETGLIVPIGEWVIRQAISEAVKWPRKLRVAINVSSIQFQRGNVVATVMNALARASLAPERVEIEITESVFLDNTKSNLDALRQLHALGVKIALDDFGTGFSALSYLLSYPFDKIKADGSFVRAIDNAAGAQTIVRAIAEIGHGMGITTTAEGIETAAQLRKVHAAGYTEAQGFLISRPLTAEAVHEMLAGEDDRMPMAPMQRAG